MERKYELLALIARKPGLWSTPMRLRMRLSAQRVYQLLQELIADGFIEVGETLAEDWPARGRQPYAYRLTDRGQAACSASIKRQ